MFTNLFECDSKMAFWTLLEAKEQLGVTSGAGM